MKITVKYEPTYAKPLWYFAERPYRITSVWEWQSVPDYSVPDYTDEDGILLDDPRVNDIRDGKPVDLSGRPF